MTADAAPLFLAGPGSSSVYLDGLMAAGRQLTDSLNGRGTPTSGVEAKTITDELGRIPVCPEEGIGIAPALAEVRRTVLDHAVAVGHPEYLGHLHCPPLISALVAEVLVSGANQSLDSFDQGPSAAVLETRVIDWLGNLLGYGPDADGVFTSGGTQSNLMGLLLARDRYGASIGWDVRGDGVPPEGRWRILCSRAAHFSVARAAAVLGMGERSILGVEVGPDGMVDVEHLTDRLKILQERDETPIALVLTAGTTEAGAIDPLRRATEVARDHGLWVHVDAALGGALVFSDRRRKLLEGIDMADSVTFDFHKLLFQPVSCAAFLVKDRDSLESLRCHAAYLNPEEDDDAGVPNLVWKSLQTTRRFDALKVFLSLRAVGRRQLGALVDRTIDAAQAAATFIGASPMLRLLVPPATNIVLFRWEPVEPRWEEEATAYVNRMLPQRLWEAGRAVIGRTRHNGRPALRLTVTSPLTDGRSITSLLEDLERHAAALAASYSRPTEVISQ